MTAAAAFLARILADPERDDIRLVYADWLQDHDDRVPCPGCGGEGTTYTGPGGGQRSMETCPTCKGERSVPAGNAARAEFIRVGVELAKWEPCNPAFEPPELPALRARERELWPAVRPWHEGMLREAGITERLVANPSECVIYFGQEHHGEGTRFVVRRGFIESVRLPTLAEFMGSLARRLGCVAGLSVVHVADRVPYHNGAGHCWFKEGRTRPNENIPESAVVPDDVFDLIPKNPTGKGVGLRWKDFPSVLLANTVLAGALGAYCRLLGVNDASR